MATLFGNNAHIHYLPFMVAYLIWLDYHFHRGISCAHWRLRAESWKEKVEGNWIESQPSSFLTIAAIYNCLMTPPGLTFIIFHILWISFSSLPFQSNLHSIAKLCESNFFVFPHLSPNDSDFFPLFLNVIAHVPSSLLLSVLSLSGCSN